MIGIVYAILPMQESLLIDGGEREHNLVIGGIMKSLILPKLEKQLSLSRKKKTTSK